MAQNTNLNVTPYYDDFDKDKNFYRVLYRPGYPIQARELTTMQSILQNQVENVGSHLFKDGAMVIPGQVGYDLNVQAIMLQESFLGANVEDYRAQLNDKIITGLTSGVKAKVLYSVSSTESDKGYITLYIKYIQSGGTDNDQTTFTNNEQLVTDTEITFGTTLIEIGSPFAQLLPTDALQTGSVAYVQEGVYFIRGFFVDVPYQYILLDQYGTNPRYRVGLEILESIVTPEDDLSLNDNAAGTSNYAAPGAHRFRITTKLIKKLIEDDADKDFIELLRINGAQIEKLVDRSAYDELEKSLALRTFEESGNYVLDEFQFTMRESVNDGFNGGIYTDGTTTAQGNLASSASYALEISPGTAYVRGYRVKNTSPAYVDIEKSRSTNSQQNTVVGFEMGNFSTITNIFGFPNVSGSSIANNYQTVELYDNFTTTPGDTSGNLIGYARVASCEFIKSPDATFGNTDDQYKLNVFDVQMITQLRLGGTTSLTAGSQVLGKNSGARAYVIDDVTSSQNVAVYQVEGTFQTGEMLTVDGLNINTVDYQYTFLYSDVRSYASRDEVTTNIEFTADIVLDNSQLVKGVSFTYDATSGSENIVGLQSNFAADLRPGDRIFFNATQYVDVDKIVPSTLNTTNLSTIFNFGTQTVNVTPPTGAAAPAAGTYTSLFRFRGKLSGQDNADLLTELPRKFVKSISDESMEVRRTFDAQTVASNSISITLPEGESFSAITDTNYTFTVLASTNSTYPVGDQIPIQTTNSGNIGYTTFTSPDRTTIQIDNLTQITSIKVTATLSKDSTQRKTKSPAKMFVMKVNKTIANKQKQNYNLVYSNLFGTRIEDQRISLGTIDAYKVHAVYESLDDEDPVIPSVTLVEPVFFATGTIVTGKTSNARARVVDFNSSTLKLTLVYLSGQMQLGETITGVDSNNAAINAIINDAEGSVVQGSKVITDRYNLETGQTGFIYETSSLVRNKNVAVPTRKLKIVLDFYNHSATGDYFGGQSYLDTRYEDISFFGDKFLADFLDFRPGCKKLYSGSGTVASPAFVNQRSFDFKSRVFPTSGTPPATILDIPKLDSVFRCDFDWYLSRIDKVFMLPTGEFQVIKGKPAEDPDTPESLSDGMLLATLEHRPYGFDPAEDTTIKKSTNRRYTMRDIGTLEKRLSNVEYYTSLNLLESDTFNTQITDANGKNRFKNGFIVDDFTDHSKSSVNQTDFSASIDLVEGVCRPSHYTTNVSLVVNDSLSTGYQKTGDVITLPYTETKIIDQPYASRLENVNPFNVFAYIGRIDLSPASDDWVETEREPARVISVEGDFEATLANQNADQNGFAPIQWGAWTNNGQRVDDVISSRTQRVRRRSNWGRGLAVDQIRTIRTSQSQRRSGVRTRIVQRLDRQSLGDTVIASAAVGWIRSRNIDVNIVRMKPRTSFFAFFDNEPIDDYLTPKVIELIKDPTTDSRTNSTPFVIGETVTGLTSGCKLKVAAPNDYFKFNPYTDEELPSSYSSTTAFLNIDTEASAEQAVGEYYGNIQVNEILQGTSGATAVVQNRRIVTDRLGQYRGAFFIPNPSEDTNPRWATGTRTMRFTTSETDSRLEGSVDSSAQVEYLASGTLNTIQENILSVRNADIVRDTVTQPRTVSSTRTETRQVGWWDPLAQSFLVSEKGGVFLTSVDVYFNTKDSATPINMQIRTMQNGYPTTTILPFADVTINPDDVQLSDTGQVATKFTFPAPVYIPQSVEHCFCLFSDSNEYKVWISRMGELDITGDRTISEQPYAGVLFKSQNATTWTADQYEDLKFAIYKATFDTSVTSRVTLNNSTLGRGNRGRIRLSNDAITTVMPKLPLVMNSSSLTYTIGARLKQEVTLAQGTIVSTDTSGGNLIVTIDDISGNWAAGSNTGGVIANRVVSSKTEATMVIASASGDFTVGEVITGGTSGATAEVVSWTSSTNTLTLNFVSTEFTAGSPGEQISGSISTNTATVTSITYSGDVATSSSAIADAFVATTPTYATTERRIQVQHFNHGMNDTDNNVIIEGVRSEVSNTSLTSALSDSDTTIQVNDATAFHTIINGQAVSASNPGYIKITRNIIQVGVDPTEEIISYSAISNDGKTITALERGVGSTTAQSHADESIVECYNLDGVPLTEINKTHESISEPTLDSYYLATTSLAKLGIKTGGNGIIASQNVQFNVLTPNIKTMLLPKTDITARVQTITGTSINDGQTMVQNSFSNTGEFADVLLNTYNYFYTPQLICSQINESSELSGAKSFRMDLNLSSTDPNVSPVIDVDRLSVTCTSDRINNPSDPNTSLLPIGDEHAAVYITKLAELTNPSGAIKVMFAGFRPPNTEIKVLYRVLPTGSTDPISRLGYEFFPTDAESATIPLTSQEEEFFDYEYEVSGLDFTAFQIKIVFVSPNQADVPKISDFRAIALAV